MKQIRSSTTQQRLVEGDGNMENGNMESSILEVSNNNLDQIEKLCVDQEEDRGVHNLTYDDIIWQFLSEMDSNEESDMLR
jgi:hypothetical protein